MTLAELRDETRRRDAQSLTPFEAHYDNPEAWIRDLERDHENGAVTDGIIWAGITGGAATLEQAYGRWLPGGNREAVGYRLRYVSAAYIARGQITALKVFCGVVYNGDALPKGAQEMTAATALAINQASWKVQKALSRMTDVDIRNGSALHLHNLDGSAWQPHPNDSIDPLPELTCAVCGMALHWANERWRDTSGAFEALDEVPCMTCRGAGVVVRAGREQRCGGCLGRKVTRVVNHEHIAEVSA